MPFSRCSYPDNLCFNNLSINWVILGKKSSRDLERHEGCNDADMEADENKDVDCRGPKCSLL